jgi:hypothetical protein
MLSTENNLWLELTSKELGVSPESLINGIIRQIRTEIGGIEGEKSLEGWIMRSKNIEQTLDATLLQARETLRASEETIKAAQLYLNQIQRSEENVLG